MSKTDILSDVRDAMARVNRELADIRARIAALNDEQADVESAPASETEALEAMRARVRHAGLRFENAEGRPPLLLGAKADFGLVFGTSVVRGGAGLVECLTIGALCWLFPREIEARLEDYLRLRWKDMPPGLPPKERAAKVAELRRRIRDLERQEEALIVEAERVGLALDRRGGVSPEVFLEIE